MNNRVEYKEHIGVMKKEVADILTSLPKGIFIDATYGYGSHFDYFTDNVLNLNFIGFDRDSEAIANAQLGHKVYKLNFSKIKDYLIKNNISELSGIFYDFGVSSHQIDSNNRGFSFQHNSNLDMRMDQTQNKSAMEVINKYSLNELINIFKKYGEIQNSKQIANSIVNSRPINTTNELKNLIQKSMPPQNPKYVEKAIRKVFQSIRIEVNDELSEIYDSLNGVKDFIQKDGAIICLTYHSLEDKIVKDFFKIVTTGCICDPKITVCICMQTPEYKYGKVKKLKPHYSEILSNSRSKSATLRYGIKL